MNVKAVLLVAGALAAGAAAYFAFQQRAVELPATPPATMQPTRLAETVPVFSLADRDGTMRTLQDWQGKSLIVNFWATWCAPCRREIPLLQKIDREHAADGFQVVGIAVDFRDKVLAYAEEMKIGYPLLIGEQEALDAATAFGIESVGFPFTVFSDNQGRVITAHVGELHEPEIRVIIDAIRALNAGQLSPEQARSQIETGLGAL
jgi:thiol-disulfide isomerase/thioredoxin